MAGEDAARIELREAEPGRSVLALAGPLDRRGVGLTSDETREGRRLAESDARRAHWNRWGPFLAARAWGTVREDYSPHGTAWEYFPHDHARSRAYRWSEDGIAGLCDRHQRICFALALWNGRDPILKERMFGLTNSEGNHGEDVKEYYWYLDGTPTHSSMKFLYKYPQAEYPYVPLLLENRRRSQRETEYELLDTGIFDEGRYFDVFVEYAKSSPEDVLVEITAWNRGPEPAALEILPTIWYRNVWSWDPRVEKPSLAPAAGTEDRGRVALALEDPVYGKRWLWAEAPDELLFTENETNDERLFGSPNRSPYVKDAFHEYVVRGQREAVNPERRGTKAAARYRRTIPPGGSARVRLRLTDEVPSARSDPFGPGFDRTLALRREEADEFYGAVVPEALSPDARLVMRQALAGMLWSKQFYHYDVRRWLAGDPGQPPPPPERRSGRNHDWTHVYNDDVLSMPDTWEFPWYAAWDTAFHCVALSLVDPAFAKDQLVRLLREWYMHPNGQIPAYEWALADVNPPVHAWAALHLYELERERAGRGDRDFLEQVFHKLLLNFTWWVNRKDLLGSNVFEGGFLGLDNIGLFDRNTPLPAGFTLGQSDGTSWMAMYSINLAHMALRLAMDDPAYEGVASKFWEHFVYIADAMRSLWDEEDGFFYDAVRRPDGSRQRIRTRSMVGLIPLFAVGAVPAEVMDGFPRFRRRMEWFLAHRADLTDNIACMIGPGPSGRRLLSLVRPDQLTRILRVMLDEEEFLSPHGIRSVSRYHRAHPFVWTDRQGVLYRLEYEPGDATSGLFGGNSNWRGPIWMPMNYMIVESLRKFHLFFGDTFRVECPTGSGRMMALAEVADELSRRLAALFLAGPDGRRPVHGSSPIAQGDPHWRDLVPFHEYFHGDDGRGLGASHQTGWTGLIAPLLAHGARALAPPEPGASNGRPRTAPVKRAPQGGSR